MRTHMHKDRTAGQKTKEFKRHAKEINMTAQKEI